MLREVHSVIEKELPIKITFSDDVRKPKKYTQHIKRVRVCGPADDFPEELRLDADELVEEGGVLVIDDLSLPKDFEIVDRRDIDPIITVERPNKEKRSGRDKRSDDYDD